MKIKIFSLFTKDHYENQESVTLFTYPAIFFFYSAFVSMHFSEAKSTVETGLKCIYVHIHPARNGQLVETCMLD